MKRQSLVCLAHQKVSRTVKPGDTVIDATMGNGHDTLFLAKLVGEEGHVFAFDIQQAAIEKTRQRLQQHQQEQQVILIHASHACMSKTLTASLLGKVSAIVFNLGYLPSGNKSIITTANSTLPALGDSLTLLKPGGLINLLIYIGHSGGKEEYLAIQQWLNELEKESFKVETVTLDDREDAPVMVSIYKK